MLSAAFYNGGFSFNTQPPEGGWRYGNNIIRGKVGFNTQPPEGGWYEAQDFQQPEGMFQHTAA